MEQVPDIDTACLEIMRALGLLHGYVCSRGRPGHPSAGRQGWLLSRKLS